MRQPALQLTLRRPYAAGVTLAALWFACQRPNRLPALPVEFWRLDGTTLAHRALARGDTGLIVLFFPDSSSLALKHEINLELNPEREFYYLKYGDLGIDSGRLASSRDSILAFLHAYNMQVLASHFGGDTTALAGMLQSRHK